MDLLQDTFLRAYTKLDSFQQGSNFKAWLCRIAANASIDRIRRRKTRRASEFDERIGPEQMATYINESELIKRLAYSMGIDVFNLVKSEQELEAEAQQQQQQAMMQSAMQNSDKMANAAATAQEVQMTAEAPPEPQA